MTIDDLLFHARRLRRGYDRDSDTTLESYAHPEAAALADEILRLRAEVVRTKAEMQVMVLTEREECARVAENEADVYNVGCCIADKIRDRGTTTC